MLSWDMITECEHHQLGFTSLQSGNWMKAETQIVSLQDLLTSMEQTLGDPNHTLCPEALGLSLGASHLSEEHPNLLRDNWATDTLDYSLYSEASLNKQLKCDQGYLGRNELHISTHFLL